MHFNEKEQFDPSEEIIITRGFAEANAQSGPGPGARQSIALTAYSGPELIAAFDGIIFFDWLSINRLWVAEEHRRKGLGKRLMYEIEKAAAERGCVGCYLNTFDFQAHGFYEKLGYKEFGIIEDCPIGHKRFFMQKRIALNNN